jgi:hypothetical protein
VRWVVPARKQRIERSGSVTVLAADAVLQQDFLEQYMNDFQQLLGRFLIFTGGMATAIRMNSAYNGAAATDPNVPVDVMWLSDALHPLDELGNAIAAGYPVRVVAACDRLISVWEGYRTPAKPGDVLAPSASDTFERWGHLADLDEGIAILRSLRESAQAAIDIAVAAG